MYQSNAYPHLVCQFSDSDTTVLHEQSPHLVDDIVISASWGPTMTWFTVHWCAASFEAVVPLFYSCDTHGIVPESLLNLSNSLHLGLAKLLAKFDAIQLLKSFRHFAIIDNLTNIHNIYTIIDGLPAGKNSRMHINIPSTSTVMNTSRAWFAYAGKIKIQYLLNRPHTHHYRLLELN